MDSFLNQIVCGDNVEVMQALPDKCIDLTVTSPPYDKLRTYNGFSFNFEEVARELYRITKDGGVVVWVVGDATIKGSETGTSFRQALYFKEIGFNLHDTMIYQKTNPMPYKHNRYLPCFEYMFILAKGNITKFNPLLEKTTCPGGKLTTSQRDADGVKRHGSGYGEKRNAERYRYNVWSYNVGKSQITKDNIAFNTPPFSPNN